MERLISRMCKAAPAAALLLSQLAGMPAAACTVWAAAGEEYAAGGGVLISKIRDEHPLPQQWRSVHDGDGYAFAGIFAGRKMRFNMGVNERGLFVARTTASSVPAQERAKLREFVSASSWRGPEFLVRRCATVAEALAHEAVFTGRPINYILADASEAAVVEVLPDGTHAVERTSRGFVSHTNHYKLAASAGFNRKTGKSSLRRRERINELLTEASAPWTMQDFESWTRDRHDGPDRSLFRTGSDPDSVRTLSMMTVHIAPDGMVHVYVQYQADPGKSSEWRSEKLSFRRSAP